MSTLLRLVDLMDAKVCTGEWGTGWQVSLRSASGLDEDLSGGVDGRLVPVATDTRFCVYCAGKPVTALCVGAIIDRGKLALDDVLGDLIEGIADPSLAVVTVDELLQHTAGLGRFPASAFLAQPVAKRDRLLRNIVPQAPRPPATTYSEFGAWELLRFAIEAASGEPFETVVAASVLDALGLPDEIVYTMSPANAETLGLNVAVRGALIEPLLWELSDTNLTECKASTGLITSARSLAQMYFRIAEALREMGDFPVSNQMLRELVSGPAHATYDPVLDRSCKLARGFMVDLEGHMFGPLSSASLGHTGLSGMTFAGCDPSTGDAFAVHINGFLERDRVANDQGAERRRQVVMQKIVSVFRAVSSGERNEFGEAL